MKINIGILYVLCALFANPTFASDKCPPIPPGGVQNKNCETVPVSNPTQCINKSVRVYAKVDKFQEIKNYFMLFSNLPYEVTEVEKNKNNSVILISYWGNGTNSFLLAEKVRSRLKSKISDFGIEKIEATYDPELKCEKKL